MSWKESLATSNPVWSAIEEYADERISDLTAVCVNRNKSEWDIRAAQAGIEELQRLKALPDLIKAEGQVRAAGLHNRKGY